MLKLCNRMMAGSTLNYVVNVKTISQSNANILKMSAEFAF